MNAVVVYESRYGNTKAVAEAIAGEVGAAGHAVELRDVRDRGAEPTGDILFVGSPVHLGSVTGRVRRFVRSLDPAAWQEKPVAVFTTILKLPDGATDEQRRAQEKYDHGAGRKLVDLAAGAGLAAVEPHLAVEVAGMKGPLVGTGLEDARRFAREMLRRR